MIHIFTTPLKNTPDNLHTANFEYYILFLCSLLDKAWRIKNFVRMCQNITDFRTSFSFIISSRS